MDLERVQAVLRPRSPAEAVDLGTLLGRRWWPMLAGAWLLTALPAAVLTHLLLSDHLLLAGLAVWWLKPLYEKAPLYFLGRAIFDDPPSLWELARHPGRFLGSELLGELTWARLRPNRSFAAPVAVLEGLRGRDRRRRLEVLGRNQSTASWLTIVFVHFEGVLYLSLLLLALWLVPAHLTPDLGMLLQDPPNAMLAADNLGYFLVMGTVAPFYVAAGFALYLNRRVALEGWDIEVSFRRLRQRLAGAPGRIGAALAVAAALGLAAPGGPAEAAPTDTAERPGAVLAEPETARSAIEEILADETFGKEATRTVWEPRFEWGSAEAAGGDWDWLGALARLLAAAGEGLLWVLAGLALLAVLLFLHRWLEQVARPALPSHRRAEGPEVLFGLAVTPESLPRDVAGRARTLCREGRTREALSLLYRASIARLIDRFEVAIPASATEGECLERAGGALAADGWRLFARLTDAWQRLAYGHRAPDPGSVEDLCRRWPAVFGESA